MESNVNLQSLDPRKQELLEARFLGSRVGNSVCCRRNLHVIGILCVLSEKSTCYRNSVCVAGEFLVLYVKKLCTFGGKFHTGVA